MQCGNITFCVRTQASAKDSSVGSRDAKGVILFARDALERERCQSEHEKLVARCEGVELLSSLDLGGRKTLVTRDEY